jgi:hypothetical protein
MAASNVVLCGIHRMPRFGDHGRLGALAFRPGQRGSFAVWDSLLISSCRPFPGPTPASSRSAANSHDMLRRPTVVRAGIGEARVREAGKGGDRLFWWHGVFPSPRRGGCRRSRRVGFMPARASPPPRFARHLPSRGGKRPRQIRQPSSPSSSGLSRGFNEPQSEFGHAGLHRVESGTVSQDDGPQRFPFRLPLEGRQATPSEAQVSRWGLAPLIGRRPAFTPTLYPSPQGGGTNPLHRFARQSLRCCLEGRGGWLVAPLPPCGADVSAADGWGLCLQGPPLRLALLGTSPSQGRKDAAPIFTAVILGLVPRIQLTND